MQISSETLKQLMRAWTTGVSVVASRHGDTRHGMTVNSFTSISLDPPIVVVTLAKTTRTHQLVTLSKSFSVSILTYAQADISDRFAGRVPEEGDRFEGLDVFEMAKQLPVIKEAAAKLACEVIDTYDMPDSTMFIARVIEGEFTGGEPLVYHNRRYYQLEKT